jgi:hypothetical protein
MALHLHAVAKALNQRAYCDACKNDYAINDDRTIRRLYLEVGKRFECPGSGLEVGQVIVDAMVLAEVLRRLNQQ